MNNTVRQTPSRRTLWILASALALLFIGLELKLSKDRYYDPDELEHIHGAWCIHHGLLPYRDYFEHHTPWYHFALAPWFSLFAVETDIASAGHYLQFARGASLVFSAATLVLVLLVGRAWDGLCCGLLAAGFLSAAPTFALKTVEARPDVMASALFLAGLVVVVKAMKPAPVGRKLFLSGLLAGAAVMCTQKALFLLPGLFVGVFLGTRGGNSLSGPAAGVRACSMMALGIATPLLVTWASFAAVESGAAFLADNFVANAQWKFRQPVSILLARLRWGDWLVIVSGAGGLLGALWQGFSKDARERAGAPAGLLIASCAVSAVAGLAVLPVAQPQYALLFLPLLALLAGRAVLALTGGWSERWRIRTASTLAMLAWALSWGQVWSLPLRRNERQLADLGFILAHSEPGDTVLDGWRGLGVFRPHAWRYFFLHREMQLMIPVDAASAFRERLRSGQSSPKLIIADESLTSWLGATRRALCSRYEFNLIHQVYVRRDQNLPRTSRP